MQGYTQINLGEGKVLINPGTDPSGERGALLFVPAPTAQEIGKFEAAEPGKSVQIPPGATVIYFSNRRSIFALKEAVERLLDGWAPPVDAAMVQEQQDRRVVAPFSPEQVEALERWQTCAWVHPLLCCDLRMRVYRAGLHCALCNAVQSWVPAASLEPLPPDPREAFKQAAAVLAERDQGNSPQQAAPNSD